MIFVPKSIIPTHTSCSHLQNFQARETLEAFPRKGGERIVVQEPFR